MRYELALLLKSLSNEDIKEKVYPRIESMLKKLKGKASKPDYVGKRLLAYEIDGNNEGYYIFSKVELTQTEAEKFQENLRGVKEVLRFMLVQESSL